MGTHRSGAARRSWGRHISAVTVTSWPSGLRAGPARTQRRLAGGNWQRKNTERDHPCLDVCMHAAGMQGGLGGECGGDRFGVRRVTRPEPPLLSRVIFLCFTSLNTCSLSLIASHRVIVRAPPLAACCLLPPSSSLLDPLSSVLCAALPLLSPRSIFEDFPLIALLTSSVLKSSVLSHFALCGHSLACERF